MSYKVAIRPDGLDEVTIQVDPKNFLVETHYDGTGIVVEVEYAKARLVSHDPEGYKAVLAAWPSVDELVLYRRRVSEDSVEWEPIFAGAITKLDTDDHEITLGALMPDPAPANPLTVDVVRDPSNLDGMSVLVAADNDGQGEVVLDFGDGSPTGHNPGDGVTRTLHAYAEAGTYTVVATDEDDDGRSAHEVVTVPYVS